MLLLKLALLNIGRNPRRTIITVLAVSVGLGSLIFLWAFMDGYQDQQRDNVIQSLTGHVQIHAKDFEKRYAPELTIPNRREILERIQSQQGVTAVAERVKCEVLIGTTENSRGVMLMGIDVAKEPQVTKIKEFIREGEFLSPDGSREILIGRDLAERIGVQLGDKTVIMTQAMDGTLAGFAYRVKGMIDSGVLTLDEMTAFVTLPSAQELLGIGKETHEIAVRLTDRRAIPPFLSAAQSFLKPDAYEMITWDQIVPWMNQWANFTGGVIRTMIVAIMIVIGVGIMNTIIMSVFERTREIGMMLAIGTSPAQIVRLIFLETLILEFFGIIFGIAAGYCVVFYFRHVGIHIPGFEEGAAVAYMSTVIYPKAHLCHVGESVLNLVVITSLVSLYPAWRAGRMEPVKAIYHPH